MPVDPAIDPVRAGAHSGDRESASVKTLVQAVGDASVVLIGEASHGTHEFYQIRADLTAALLEQQAFDIVAVEADWPDAARASRWVRLQSDEADAVDALGGFTRFPRWMWRNDVVVEYFFAEQNARLVRNAEQYYRAMFGDRAASWNLRDTHMMETLEALMEWTRGRGGAAKAVVWAHNSHLGDARATQMADWGELNLGQEADLPETYPVGVCL